MPLGSSGSPMREGRVLLAPAASVCRRGRVAGCGAARCRDAALASRRASPARRGHRAGGAGACAVGAAGDVRRRLPGGSGIDARPRARSAISAVMTARTTTPMATHGQPDHPSAPPTSDDATPSRSRSCRAAAPSRVARHRRFAIYEQASSRPQAARRARRPRPRRLSRAAALPRLARRWPPRSSRELDEPVRPRAGVASASTRPAPAGRLCSALCSPSRPAGSAAWLLERAARGARRGARRARSSLRRATCASRCRRARSRARCPGPSRCPAPGSRFALRVGPRAVAAWLSRPPIALLAAPGGDAQPRHPVVVWAQRSAPRQPPWRWYHPLWKFVGFALVPAAVLFNAHQHIAYGGTLGQYYLEGLACRICARSRVYWLMVAVYLVL